jgi:hypothetical protein
MPGQHGLREPKNQRINLISVLLSLAAGEGLRTLISSVKEGAYTATKIHVFPEKELRGLSPNFHIHVSVSDLCIPRISPHIFMGQNRQTDGGNI